MTTYELYINGLLCDLDTGEAITLRYQSPLFSELDSIQSNRSYNISLPLSPNNLQAIGQSQRVDVNTNVPYKRLSASLYMNGVPLFTKGYAVVTDISDTINVTLTWGNVDNFQPLFDNSLRDLGPQLEELGADHIDWNESSRILDANTQNEYPGVAFWGVNFGMGLSNPKYIHPSVQVTTILDAIERQHGITIDGKERLAYSPNLGPIVPLVGKNGDEVSWKEESSVCSPIRNEDNTFTFAKGSILEDRHSIIDESSTFFTIKSTGKYNFNIGDGLGEDFSIRLFFSRNKPMEITVGKDGETIGKYQSYNMEVIGNSTEFYFHPISIDVEGPCSIVIGSNYDLAGINLQNAGFDVYIWKYDWDMIFPTSFAVAANLPDMSQGDFILALMNMNGLFAYADKDEPDMIRLISIDDIMSKAESGDVVDWSEKVILNDFNRVDMPDASEFTIDNLAQSNILDYDNDDDVETDTHGIIKVNNENIDKETELVTLPFSASENESTDGVSCALVPIYEQQDNGDVNYTECSDRILSGRGGLINGLVKCIGVFDPWMKFGGSEGIVEARYSAYRRVVSKVRLITIRAKLFEVDLLNLDYAKPIYISQFGQLFAIYSVETGENGVCDCELLTLNYRSAYYIQINGQSSDYETTEDAQFHKFDVPIRTNGNVSVSNIDGGYIEAQISDDLTLVHVIIQKNQGYQRIGTIALQVDEDPTVTRKIIITQIGALLPKE